MAERAYTVKEIDELREACETRWLFGTTVPREGWGRHYRPEEKAVAVEEIVRTHMLAGHTAADLHEEDRVKAKIANG